jgi:hypothetical protein
MPARNCNAGYTLHSLARGRKMAKENGVRDSATASR